MGKAFLAKSHVANDDAEFFKAIGISPLEISTTSFTGNDVVYYNPSKVVPWKGSMVSVHQMGGCEPRADVRNPMLKLMNEHPDEEVKAKAKMLLRQYDTAAGMRIKHELEAMLQEYGY